ncbi:PEP-CTERM sorting domain-containing protein [Verrucomicrobiaceae bacterium N1E253]|uniref:PEP-CTERM sorting domain-containing protein n=1 Tax=Oceaniferula marina TaxID=2748318 RepID=A0A851GLR0_9BACT|nr:PEP-CTERM sorting domain-containing protein [Oceaniferula marina]NWK55074.1 PEP-CTERM sorting domain-containing protein [Oceaniferula marina]
MNKTILTTALTISLAALCQSASAATVLPLLNGDFQNTGTGKANLNRPANWTGTNLYRADNSYGYNSRGVLVRGTGDAYIYQRGTLTGITEPTINLKGWAWAVINSGPADVGTVTLKALGGAAGDRETSFTFSGSTIGNDNWTAFDLSIEKGDATQWEVHLNYDEKSNNYAAVRFDELTLQAVPEPSSAALLGLGGLSLILRRRK